MKKISHFLVIVSVFLAGMMFSRRLALKIIINKHNAFTKYMLQFNFANEWLAVRQKGINISSYLIDRGYYSIAIYGMEHLGERLVDELRNTDINIRYAIDSCRKNEYAGVTIKDMNEFLPQVDAVIVTDIYDFWGVASNLDNKFRCPIISIEDIIYKSKYSGSE